jgi:hypothetical protein
VQGLYLRLAAPGIIAGLFFVSIIGWLGLLVGLVTGGGMAAYVGGRHARAVRGTDQTEPNCYSMHVTYPGSSSHVRDTLVALGPTVDARAHVTPERDVLLKFGGTSRVWGCMATVKLTDRGDGTTDVHITSRTWQFVDYGENRRHVVAVAAALTDAVTHDDVLVRA